MDCDLRWLGELGVWVCVFYTLCDLVRVCVSWLIAIMSRIRVFTG